MEHAPEAILENAQCGEGPCANCSVQKQTQGQFVNPGLGNVNADVMFISEEPRHIPDWDEYDSWAEYNEVWWPRVKRARGGRFLARILSRVDYTLDDLWLTDSVKCPTKADESRNIPSAETNKAASQCATYLRREIEEIDPRLIISLGRRATRRTLRLISSEPFRAQNLKVTEEYGHCEFDTAYPVVISLHWAQRTLAESEWVPVVQRAIAEVLSSGER